MGTWKPRPFGRSAPVGQSVTAMSVAAMAESASVPLGLFTASSWPMPRPTAAKGSPTPKSAGA